MVRPKKPFFVWSRVPEVKIATQKMGMLWQPGMHRSEMFSTWLSLRSKKTHRHIAHGQFAPEMLNEPHLWIVSWDAWKNETAEPKEQTQKTHVSKKVWDSKPQHAWWQQMISKRPNDKISMGCFSTWTRWGSWENEIDWRLASHKDARNQRQLIVLTCRVHTAGFQSLYL